jgi:exodeoxyribonuclease III
MKVVSWNVNGLRACEKKGFLDWLEQSNADVVGLQEVRAEADQLSAAVRRPKGWHTDFFAAERKGYSGVGLYTRRAPDDIVTVTGVDEFDVEGRIQHLQIGQLSIWNVYFPNGNGKDRDLSRIPYKLRFYDYLLERLQPELEAGRRILVMGDFNTAHQEIDLARPKSNHETSGFRPEERAAFAKWIEAGWTDTFRQFVPEAGHYSWWSQRQGVRARNIGWRIDYVLASPAAQPYVLEAAIHVDVLGSDHCPVSVTLDSTAAEG